MMAGEVVDCGSVWQGWPANQRQSLTHHRAQVRYLTLSMLAFVFLFILFYFNLIDYFNFKIIFDLPVFCHTYRCKICWVW